MSNDYPDRPDHPDFWLIAQALLDQDAQADAGQDAEEIISRMIHLPSAAYAATQRAARVSKPFTSVQVAAAWLDGFLAGMRVQQAKHAETPAG